MLFYGIFISIGQKGGGAFFNQKKLNYFNIYKFIYAKRIYSRKKVYLVVKNASRFAWN